MTNTQHNAALNNYKESAALEQLLKAADAALQLTDERLNDDDYELDQFTITVGGIQTAFVMGAPQYEALLAFIQHIADENLYAVDFNKLTVSE